VKVGVGAIVIGVRMREERETFLLIFKNGEKEEGSKREKAEDEGARPPSSRVRIFISLLSLKQCI
jgi:hypothetical protein